MENGSDNNQSQQIPPTPTYTPSPAPVPNAPAQQHSGLAIAAMVVGIVSILFGWVPFLGLALGIAAIIMGIISLKHKYSKGMSIAGIATGAVSTLWNLAISAILIIGIVSVGVAGNGIVNELNENISSYNQDQQTKVDAKKDFAKGTTAIFGDFEIKVNSIKRNFIPDDEYYEADDGNELILVNITVKNISDTSEYVSSYSLDLNDNGSTDTTSYANIDDSFESESLSAGESSTGNLVFEVTKNSTNLKLQYEETVYPISGDSVDLVYTLAL